MRNNKNVKASKNRIFRLDRIGRKYNSDRKELADKIESLKKLMKHDDSYSRINHQKQIDELEKTLQVFDSKDTAFISDNEWKMFSKLLDDFREIGEAIGGILEW